MHPNHDAQSVALALPVELYYDIFSHLDINDVFALRKTCKRFLAITRECNLWSMLFARLRTTQALPCSRAQFMAMSPTQAERALWTASKVEASFLEPREHDAHNIPPVNGSTSSWRMLTFISDRFIFSVDTTAVAIWDTSAFPPASPAVVSSPWAHFHLSNIIGYVDCYSVLYIAVSRVHMDQRSAIIFSVRLPPLEESAKVHPCLHEEAEFPLRDGEQLKHMDPDSNRALLYCAPDSFQVVHWRDADGRTAIPMSIHSDDLDVLWDGITSLRFCGPYILCFRLRSVEAYPIPSDTLTAQPLPVLRHRFGPVCFRAVSLSHVRRCRSGETYTIFMLTNDIYKGMFHYYIRVTIAPVPSMSVQVLAQGGIQSPDLLPVIPGTETRYTLADVFGRMFFSTWSLGSSGLRGVWVDRQRGSIDRRVVAFTTHPGRLRTKAKKASSDSDPTSDGDRPDWLDDAPTMEGKVVRVIASYDLRDDVTICAVSEWTGRIAMVSRAGSILLI